MTEKTVSFYTKSGCSLCDRAMKVIAAVRMDIPFNLECIDITGSFELTETYGLHVPVVCIDGTECFRYHVSEKQFRSLLLGDMVMNRDDG